MSIRNEMNQAGENRLDSALRQVGAGDLVNALIAGLSVTETPTASSNVLTLANQPSFIFDANATGGTSTGRKTVLGPAPITGTQKVTPAPGQCVWDGGKKILFNTADAVTTVAMKYATAADATASCLQREIGQNP